MCCSFVIINLLVIKVLLGGLMGVNAATLYNYAYHPSAEEFDNLLEETRRTWTHAFLKDERDRFLMQSAEEHHPKIEARQYVPKFQYANDEPIKFSGFKSSQGLQAVPTKSAAKPIQNIDSLLEFNYFSDERPKPLSSKPTKQPSVFAVPDTIQIGQDTKPASFFGAEIDLKPLARPEIFTDHKYSLNSVYKNNTPAHSPIYFTNPSTGVVYAITEVGKSTQNFTKNSGPIPIFITKEQYDRDIQQLKNVYKQKCPIKFSIPGAQNPLPHTSTVSPTRPNLKSLVKPSPVVIKTELIVKDRRQGIAASSPQNMKIKLKTKKTKSKGSKRPGHRTLSTTLRPIIANQPDGPKIILGTRTLKRKPSQDNEKFLTQLEKPDFNNIFSKSKLSLETKPKTGSVKSQLTIDNHKISKRSPGKYKPAINFDGQTHAISKASMLRKNFVKNSKDKFVKKIFNIKTVPKEYLIKSHDNLNKNNTLFLNFLNTNRIETDFNKEINLRNLDHKQQLKSSSTDKLQNFLKHPLGNSLLMARKHHVNKRSFEDLPKNNLTLTAFVETVNKNSFAATEPKIKNASLLQDTKTKSIIAPPSMNLTGSKIHFRKKLQSKANEKGALTKVKKSKPKTHSNSKKPVTKTRRIEKKSERKDNAVYNIFDSDENYDYSDDGNEDGDESDEEEYEEEYEDDEKENEDSEQEQEKLVNEEAVNDYEILAYNDQTHQVHTIEAGLSAEDSSKKTVRPGSSPHKTESELDKPQLKSSRTPTKVKKHIRHRPAQHKVNKNCEDTDDHVDDNNMSSNLNEFVRMIFYPIELVFSTVMESLGFRDTNADIEQVDENTTDHVYSRYTPYHKILKGNASEEYAEDYVTNEVSDSSLNNWFSSWFSFNRRVKKMDTTTARPVNLERPTRSSSWLPSWLSFGANDRISTESASNEDYDEYDKWFASWFGEAKPKSRKRTTTTTTSTTTQMPQVPILTIVDPMRNPQTWLGILAHHIINQTSTSTIDPLKKIWHKATPTTTENEERPQRISYDKYQIWRLKPQDDRQVKSLEEYKKSEDGIKLQWLKGPSLRGLTDVLVPPNILMDFQASLTFELIDHEVLIFDVGKAIDYERNKEDYTISITQKSKKNNSKHTGPMATMSWHKYYEFGDIMRYLETMRMRFPHLVELIHIGRSYEGRPLIVVKIESKEAAAVNSAHYTANQANKLRHKKRIGLANAVFIEAGTHGLEWIGPATATYIINELLRIMKRNVTDDQGFMRNTTWYVMPVLNPDSYVYSHEFDRFWKKSRSRHVSRPSGILSSAMSWLQQKRNVEKVCFGVDLDRNWDYQWGRRGSSKSACNEFYAGPRPFSEPETKALSEFLMDYRGQIKLFVSMQSYGQVISYPYKANSTHNSERLDDLLDVAVVGTDGLRRKGSKSRYKIDSSNDLVEKRSGSSDAFAAYEAGITFSYTLQLADNGIHGYLLPSASIEPAAKDSFEIILGMLSYI